MTLRRPLAILAIFAVLFWLAGSSTALADGSWLDATITSWNTAGAAIPAAPTSGISLNRPLCGQTFRAPETGEDAAVAAEGWMLFGAYESGWSIRIVHGEAGADGMCRPESYQVFVFVGGVFVGTISPGVMNSRADGAESFVTIGMTSTGDNRVDAEFERYGATDPLCCPSKTDSLSFSIEQQEGGPVLVPAPQAFTLTSGT